VTALAAGDCAPRLLDRRRIALALGWAGAAVALAIFALWLVAIPQSISSDDALFLLHSLTRFSILDFSPQFPGYPGFVAMGRAALVFMHDPLAALALTSALVAIAIPPAAAWVVWRTTGVAWAALAAFFATLLCPLLPDLAVSLLTDGAGILFLLVFLAVLPVSPSGHVAVADVHRPSRLFLAGLALGWALACRPSDAPLLGGAFVAVVVVRPRWVLSILAGAAAALLPVALVVYAAEGALYLQEGLRFLLGHTAIWGNTAFAPEVHRESWWTAAGAIPFAALLAPLLLAGAVVALRQRSRPPALTAAIAAFVCHAAWIAAFQNPDHLRHLAPLAILGGIIFVSAVTQVDRLPRIALVAALLAAETGALIVVDPLATVGQSSSLAAAQAWLAARQPVAIATNEGVFTLRQALPNARVYDMYYAADAALGLATASVPAFRLTGTPVPDANAAAVFPARFPGERTLWLYPASLAR
jgi:hypothetical protein